MTTLVDFTHPGQIPPLYLPNDKRSAEFYLRLDELPESHPYFAINWALFRYPDWLEGGSAWVHARTIAMQLDELKDSLQTLDELRPVVGSGDHDYDEALAQALRTFGYRPKVAELVPRNQQLESENA